MGDEDKLEKALWQVKLRIAYRFNFAGVKPKDGVVHDGGINFHTDFINFSFAKPEMSALRLAAIL